jgi:hypothetical protein
MLSLISNFTFPNSGIIRCRFLSIICRLVRSRVEASNLLYQNSHFQFVYYLHTFRNEVFWAFVKVLLCIVWVFAHFNKCRFNECLCLFKVQCAITIVIKFVSNVLYHRIYGVVYVFVLFTVHVWLGFSGFYFFILKVSVIVTVSTS